jgi:hypothetical protein
MFVMLFLEFLLDDAFHFKEAADLLRIKHGRLPTVITVLA